MISVSGMHAIFTALDAGDAIMEAMYKGAVQDAGQSNDPTNHAGSNFTLDHGGFHFSSEGMASIVLQRSTSARYVAQWNRQFRAEGLAEY